MKWSGMPTRKSTNLKLYNGVFQLPEEPFGTELPLTLGDTSPLRYKAEGKRFDFLPLTVEYDVAGAIKERENRIALSEQPETLKYSNTFGTGIDIGVGASQCHWRKLVKFRSLAELGAIPEEATALNVVFEITTDFDLPDGVYINPGKRKLGKDVYLEQPKAWDSSYLEPLTKREKADGLLHRDNTIPVSYTVSTAPDGKRYFTKSIPVSWLKAAVFPVYTDTDMSWGSAYAFTGSSAIGTSAHIFGDMISSDDFAIATMQPGGGNDGYAYVGNRSGDTISFGSGSSFCNDISVFPNATAACKLDTDKFLVCYADDAAGDDGFVRAVTVSGTTIGSWGTALEFDTSNCNGMTCCQLDTDKAVVVYEDAGTGDVTAIIITASGTTLSAGTAVAVDTTPARSFIHVAKLDSTHFVVGWGDSASSPTPRVVVCSVSGTTITAGTSEQLDTGLSTACVVASLSSSKFVAVWDNDTDDDLEAIICTVSGTTITKGSVTKLHTGASSTRWVQPTVCMGADGDAFLVAARDVGDSNKGKTIYSTVSGTTITAGSEETFNDAATGSTSTIYHPIALIRIDGSNCIIVYRDDGDANDIGEARVGTFPSSGTTISPTGIGSVEGVGSPQANLKVAPTGIGEVEGIGSPQANLNISPSGVASAEGIGSPVVGSYLSPAGIASVEGLGSPVVAGPISPNGIASVEALGQPSLALYIVTVGIGTTEALGEPALAMLIQPSGIGTPEGLGTPIVSGPIAAQGIATVEGVGAPQLNYTIQPSGIATVEGIGTPLLVVRVALAVPLRYIVEIHDSDGDLVSILENATRINYSQATNQVPTLRFDLPADDSKRSGIAWGNEIWLRDYRTGTVVRKFRLSNVRDKR